LLGVDTCDPLFGVHIMARLSLSNSDSGMHEVKIEKKFVIVK
jgi:hypothetical protein